MQGDHPILPHQTMQSHRFEIGLTAKDDHDELHDPVVLDQGRPILALIQSLNQTLDAQLLPKGGQIGSRFEVDVRPQQLILADVGDGRSTLTEESSPSRLYIQIRLPGSSDRGDRDPVPSAGMAREVLESTEVTGPVTYPPYPVHKPGLFGRLG